MANMFSLPMVICGTKLVSNLPMLRPRARNSHERLLVHEYSIRKLPSVADSGSPFLYQPLIQRSFSSTSRHGGLLSLVQFNNAKSSEPGEELGPALEIVLNLYTAIKNQNIQEISNTIGDECRCVCNFFSFFESFQGKQQVLEFFKYLMKILGNNIEFVVQPTSHDGMNVGISWKLEWSKTHMPLGKGFCFYICQKYQGKMLIRNVEIFMEPLLHIEPSRLKIMAYMMNIAENISYCCKLTRYNVKKVIFCLVSTAIILLFMKPGSY